MPASLDSLPDELLRLIVECVQDDDKAWRDLGLVRGADDAAQATTVAASASCGGDQQWLLPANVIEGRWSSWYGRGVIALGTVNRRLRSLVRPVFYKSLDWRRIDTSFFRYLVLGEPVARLIEHVDLDISQDDQGVPCIALASALKMLPGVTSLGLNGRPSDFIKDAHASFEDAEFLASRIEQTLAQVDSLTLSDVSESDLEDILRLVDAGSLRRLDVDWSAQEASFDKIAGALQHLRVLETLSLGNLYLSEDWVMGLHAPLSSVRELTIRGALRSDDALHIAATLTPNVQSLTVSTCLNLHRSVAMPKLDQLAAACTAKGIDLVVQRPLGRRSAISSAPTTARSSVRARAEAVRETLEWALRRTDWLKELEDEQGVGEMEEATVRLRERQWIERAE